MVNYKEILYRLSLNQGQRQIRGSMHCSDNTIRAMQRAAKEMNVAWPLNDDVTNVDLEQLLFPDKHKASSQYAKPDYPYIHRELARPGVILTLLWEEYCAKYHETGRKPYMSTQFGERCTAADP